ncbi:hypothetical protein [Halosegnis longus]|uniref:hypothetical protein n=1 Tax=Halosegnis longus TaxID=2216012 RepID=UPI001314B1AF
MGFPVHELGELILVVLAGVGVNFYKDRSVGGFNIRDQFTKFLYSDVSVNGLVFTPLESLFLRKSSNFLPVGAPVASLRGVLGPGTSLPVDEVLTVCGFVQRLSKVMEVTQVCSRSVFRNLFSSFRVVQCTIFYSSHYNHFYPLRGLNG